MSDPSAKPGVERAALTGRLLIVAAAIMWSSSGFFAKAPHFVGWPGWLLAFWRATFACMALFPLVRRVAWSWKMVPMMATFTLMNLTYMSAMKLGSAANAIWLQNTAPVWVLLVGVFIFREAAQWRDWLLIGFSLVGVAIILFFEMRGTAPDAVLYGLASGLFYAGVILALRHLRQFDSAWLVALNHAAAAATFFPFMLRDEHWPTGIQWPFLIGFGILQMGLPYTFFARGLRTTTGHEASGIGLLEPLLVPVWVYCAWGEVPAWWTIVGGAFILMGLVVRYMNLPERTTKQIDANENV